MSLYRRMSIVTILITLVACSKPVGRSHSEPAARNVSPLPPTGSPSGVNSLSGRIAFDNQDDVWSINADGTDLKQLTRSHWPEFDPTWSPDGTQIAYRSEPHGDQEIWVMNADGSDQQRLTRGLSPAWSPDGSKIAYASPGKIACPPGRGLRCTGISIMNADGSGQHRVPNTDVGEYPSWSPDGKQIVFNANSSGDHLMYVVNLDGSRLVDLSYAGEGWQVDWSPDGRSILFASGRDEEPYDDIYVMRPDGSGVKRLTHIRGYAPAWSSDGSHIVFSAPGGLFVMRADGSGITSLPVDGVGVAQLPDWVRYGSVMTGHEPRQGQVAI